MYDDDDDVEDEEESESAAAAEMDERIPVAKKNLLNEVNASSKNYGPPHAANMGEYSSGSILKEQVAH